MEEEGPSQGGEQDNYKSEAQLAANTSRSPGGVGMQESAAGGTWSEVIGGVSAELTPHLSRGIRVAYEPVATRAPKLPQRRDLDLLIADWGVHHLHLSTHLESDGFVSRTDDLLFSAFAMDDAYLINIYPHGSWGLVEMLEILIRNWPDANVLQAARYAVGVRQHFTDDDRLALRNIGIALPVEIDGRVYMPPSLSLVGSPLSATRRMNQFMWELEGLRDLAPDLVAQLDRASGQGSSGARWEPEVREGGCGFTRDGSFVPVLALRPPLGLPVRSAPLRLFHLALFLAPGFPIVALGSASLALRTALFPLLRRGLRRLPLLGLVLPGFTVVRPLRGLAAPLRLLLFG